MKEVAFDRIVLGTGVAGAKVAERCARAGQRVAIAESREIGGTCALRGCNPKKVLVHAAELLDATRRAEGTLGRYPEARIAWSELIAFEHGFVDPLPDATEESLKEAGVEILHGPARFVALDAIAADGRRASADQILIATGAMPALLDLPGSELLATSDDFLVLPELPRSILFLGGGFVSFELAHVARRAGAEATIYEREERTLAGFEPELVDRLVAHGRELGIDLRTRTEVTALERRPGGGTIATTATGARVTFDLVVHGVGRVPNLVGLDLDAANVESGPRGIRVDGYLRSTSNPRVLAAGDCADSGAPPLTPVASAHADCIAHNWIAGEDRSRPDVEGIARVVFTVPPLAAVGLTEERARRAGLELDVRAGEHADWNATRKVGQRCAAYKLIVDAQSDRLLGAHVLGPRADELANLFTLALRKRCTATELASTPFAFPTFGHDVRSMF